MMMHMAEDPLGNSRAVRRCAFCSALDDAQETAVSIDHDGDDDSGSYTGKVIVSCDRCGYSVEVWKAHNKKWSEMYKAAAAIWTRDMDKISARLYRSLAAGGAR